MVERQPRTYGLAVATYRDKETGVFVAHCLTYDLMECGPTPDAAWQNIKRVIKAHIEHCYTHYKTGLERSAKQEEWDMFFESIKRNPEAVQIERIQIELRPPMPETEIPFWIQKVNKL